MSNDSNRTHDATTPVFAKPRIMLIDMDRESCSVLRDAGYNVAERTFGAPRIVGPSDSLYPVQPEWAQLKGFQEHEIFLINCAKTESVDDGFADPGDGVERLWQNADRGDIDGRPLAMMGMQQCMSTIMEHGGIAIVQLGRNYKREFLLGRMYSRFNFRKSKQFILSSWGFSADVDRLRCEDASGEEIQFLDEGGGLSQLLKKGASSAKYETRIAPEYDQKSHFLPLAKDKFGFNVAGLLIREEPQAAILLLPQMPEFHRIAVELIRDWCTKWRPQLFPYHENQAWLHSDRYEMESVKAKSAQIATIRLQANAEIKRIEDEIQADRDSNPDWYTLLSGTGDDLVQAVMNALQRLGFQHVVDMDEEARQSGSASTLREDVQIRDKEPILVVDIKGVIGTPEDGESTQAQKHALMRTREMNKYVKPLTIINHQRNFPPHERSPSPYRSEIVQNAKDTGLGLMTTWDIFRLLRNCERLSWTHDRVAPIFYRDGRIEPIPSHYSEAGTIAHVWKGAIGIVPNNDFALGSVLAIEVDGLFRELKADSVFIDEKPAEGGLKGCNCGIKCEDTSEFRDGMRVFFVDH